MPSAPTGCLATHTLGTQTIVVSWTNQENYYRIQLYNSVDGPGFSSYKTWTVSRESFDDTGRTNNIAYGYRVRGSTLDAQSQEVWSDFSNDAYITLYADTADDTIELDEDTTDQTWIGDVGTDTIELDESASGGGVIVDSTTDGITLLDSPGDIFTLTLETNYGYYFGDFSGKIYYESDEYGSDDGTAINAYWLSKDTDFADIDEDALSRYKTVYKARLFYVDLTAGQSVVISVSTDGGTTWTPSGRNIGTGDGTIKSTDFFFIKTGDVFQFKINHDADSGKFQWINMEVLYSVGGDYFEVA